VRTRRSGWIGALLVTCLLTPGCISWKLFESACALAEPARTSDLRDGAGRVAGSALMCVLPATIALELPLLPLEWLLRTLQRWPATRDARRELEAQLQRELEHAERWRQEQAAAATRPR
jgi:hypothetical protein